MHKLPEAVRSLLATTVSIVGLAYAGSGNIWRTLDAEKAQSLRTLILSFADDDYLKANVQPVVTDLDDSVLLTSLDGRKGLKRKRDSHIATAARNVGSAIHLSQSRSDGAASNADRLSWEGARWKPVLRCLESHWQSNNPEYTQHVWLPLHDLTPRELAAMESDEAGMRQIIRAWLVNRAM